MTKQQIFNLVVEGFAKQGELAFDTTAGICVYRTSKGSKCAIGMLIPDELYSKRIEYNGVDSLLADAFYKGLSPRSLSIVGEHLYSLLNVNSYEEKDHDVTKFFSALQNVHDSMASDSWEDTYPSYMNFPQRLLHFAKNNTLESNVIVDNLVELTKIKMIKRDDKTAGI